MKGQGSLEYLIIIAIVLSISSIVVLYATGIIGTQTTSVSLSSCKQASIDCKLSKMSSPTDTCDACISACANTTINPCSQPEAVQGVSHGAIGCCKKGLPEEIYMGSVGCGTPVHLNLGGNMFYAPYDWESTKASTFCLIYPLYKVSRFDPVLGQWYSYVCEIASPTYDKTYDFYVCPGMYVVMSAKNALDVIA